MQDHKLSTKDENDLRLAAMRWHGWGSPVGLGIFLLLLAGGLALLAVGIKLLASIG